MKKLYLVDVSSMFFRAFFALPHLTNDKGLPTNALYGFLSMTIKLLREIKPDYLVFCFDRKEPSFRYEIYPEYKAHREEMPEDLVPQVPFVRQLTEALGIAHLDREGFEADDVIGSLTRWGRDHNCEVVIVSGDKDFAQLIAPAVTMYDTMKDVRYDTEGVKAKWGVDPEQMIDYLALVGDSSDNIPGVKGIGPKGAQKLLHEFRTLDGVYQHLDLITGKAMRANLEANRDMAYLSKKLVTIRQDIELAVREDDLRLKPIDREKLKSLLLDLGFKSFARTLLGEEAASTNQGEVAPLNPDSGANRGAQRSPPAAETPRPSTSSQPRPANIQEIEWSLAELRDQLPPYSEVWSLLSERGFYLGWTDKVIRVAEEPQKIGEVLSRKMLSWCGFDLKETWTYLHLQEPVANWDQMLAAYVVRAGNIGDFAEVYRKEMDRPLPDLMSPAQHYALQFELRARLQEQVSVHHGERVLQELELPLVAVLYEMESRGIRVDLEELERQRLELNKDIQALEQSIFREAGGPFNVASPKQLAQILFEKLKLNPGKKTKTGYSTDSDVLEKLSAEHPIAGMLIEYRELSKLKSTYVDALPQLVNKTTGRVHTHFNQAATATGRLSSQSPNLQNIPIRTERGRQVRRAFVAESGHLLISADYSQIELRILAHIADDEGLCRAFAEDLDIHTATASEIFSVPMNQVTADLRRTAKAVNFGIAYGQGAFGLSETLGISRQEASEIIERYFRRFKGVRDYMERTVKSAQQMGYVETIFGRRRYLDELKSKNQALRKFGERAAINAPIQGTASDLVKAAMIQLHQEVSCPMLLQVHDELLFECPEADVAAESERIRKRMENVTKLKVPLRVNVAVGRTWEEAHA